MSSEHGMALRLLNEMVKDADLNLCLEIQQIITGRMKEINQSTPGGRDLHEGQVRGSVSYEEFEVYEKTFHHKPGGDSNYRAGRGDIEKVMRECLEDPNVKGFSYNWNERSYYMIQNKTWLKYGIDSKYIICENNPNIPGKRKTKRWEWHALYIKK